jgi:predicted ArsR family transcriptional regulator
METPIKDLGRELLSNGGVSQAELVLATGLPSWKISRIFKRLELLKFIEVEKEPRFTRGRPRKVGRLTSEGVEYFTGLLGGARENLGSENSQCIHKTSVDGMNSGGEHDA